MQDETIVEIHYCPHCIQKIVEFGYPAVNTYYMIVENCVIFSSTYKHLESSNFVHLGGLEFLERTTHPFNWEDTVLNFLEKTGFILTSDIYQDGFLDVCPKGITFNGNEYFVCADKSHDFI